MKSLLYIATNPIDLNHLGGVEKKILSHCKCFSKHFKTYLINYSACYEIHGEDVDVLQKYNLGTRLRRFMLFKRALDIARKERCNIYIRYPYTDPFFLSLCIKLKRGGCRTVIEIPTYPYSNNHDHTFFSNLRLKVDTFLSKFLKNYVDRIVTYSNDIEIFGIKTINTVNGVDFSAIDLVPIHNNSNEIHLISVAHLYSCHGYDRVISGLANYYKTNPLVLVYFHIVGEGDVYEELRKMVSSHDIEKFVIFHGFLNGNELSAIYNNSDVAVNSLAIHRIGLTTESTLKAKEYCAKGLPIVTAFELDSLSEDDNKMFTLRVPLNDDPIDIFDIVNFYKELQFIPNYNSTIRERSKLICDMPRTMEPIVSYFLHYGELI